MFNGHCSLDGVTSRQILKKAADGGRNEVSGIASCVIIKFVSSNHIALINCFSTTL